MTKQDIQQLAGRSISFNPAFARVAGSVTAGLMLTQLNYWTGKEHSGNGWIYKTREEMEAETTLSRTEQETARRRLQQLNILKVKLKGVPAKLHYWIDYDELARRLTSLQETCNLDGGKPANQIAETPQTNTEITPETTSEILSPTDLGQLTLTAPESEDEPFTPEDLKESWNDFAKRIGLPVIIVFGEGRRRKTAARLRDHPEVQFWSQVLTNIELSPFLREKWRITFDWLMENSTNALKVYEGNYNHTEARQFGR